MFDLSKEDFAKTAEQGYKLYPTYPNGNRLGDNVWILVRGEHSEILSKFTKSRFNEEQRKEALAARKSKNGVAPVEPKMIEDYEDLLVERAVLSTISWNGFTVDGKEVEFTPEIGAKYYKKFQPLANQVIDASSDASNFFR